MFFHSVRGPALNTIQKEKSHPGWDDFSFGGRYRTRLNHRVAAIQLAASSARPRRIWMGSSPIPNTIPKEKSHPGWDDFSFGGRYRTRTYDLPHVKRML